MSRGVLVLAVLIAATPLVAAAQPVSADAEDPVRLRYQIQTMEGVLERAVRHGAETIGRQMQDAAPQVMLFTGPARARGFVLEGYGLFFDVDVPALRRSVAWTLRTFQQHDLNLTNAIEVWRRHVQTLQDPRARSALEQALKRIELQIGPPQPAPGERRATAAALGGQLVGPEPLPEPLQVEPPEPPPALDPDRAYTEEVKRALMDAMLDYSASLSLGPDEWLTVAARDNEGPLMPGELQDSTTLILRVRGRDLAAVRADRLSRDQARKRIEVREF